MFNYKFLLFLCLNLLVFNGKIFSQEQINKERKNSIDSLAMEKVRDLSKYISIIGNKKTSFSKANRVIDRAVELFAIASKISVSSLNSNEIETYEVRKYLKRLNMLSYDEVTIEWYRIEYFSSLELQPDGRYVGVVTIYQKFEGRNKDQSIYVDNTKKDLTIYVEKKTIQIDGTDTEFWNVLLGDIRVKETHR